MRGVQFRKKGCASLYICRAVVLLESPRVVRGGDRSRSVVPSDGHLSAEHLVRVAGGEIDEEQRRRALSHLEQCEECGDRLATILLLRHGGRRRRFVDARTGLLATAAGLVLIVSAWALYIAGAAEREPAGLTAEQRALAQQWAPFASRDNVDDMLYDFALRVAYPDVVAGSPDQRHRRTRDAVIALRDERYDEAAEELLELNLEYPESDAIAGWLGVALHLSGDTDPRVEGLLERGMDSGIDLLQELGLWYGAHQLLLTGRPQEAVERLGELAEDNGRMGRLARALLARMPLDELELELGEGQRLPFVSAVRGDSRHGINILGSDQEGSRWLCRDVACVKG